jgi:hypothetical protein
MLLSVSLSCRRRSTITTRSTRDRGKLEAVADTDPKPPSTYNIGEFMSQEVDIDTDRIPEYPNESAARAAGHVAGDIFRTPGGKLGIVGVIPPDGRE